MKRWLGIDFSGNHQMWRPSCGRSNVWVAEIEGMGKWPRLLGVRPVQKLAGVKHPFDRLVDFLASGDFTAAAIDAPFSVPETVSDNHSALLSRTLSLPTDRKRPFPTGSAFVEELCGPNAGNGRKDYRSTESKWKVNVRSTIWAGPRGGAAMTVACLTLLGRVNRPVWPWSDSSAPGLLAEAFPAAQLKSWGLAHDKYNGSTGVARERRETIVSAIESRMSLSTEDKPKVLDSADALDAVLCGFAAVAVTMGYLVCRPEPAASSEGWIAVHD